MIELKYHEGLNPFEPRTSKYSASSRVQMVRYIVETFLRQHRECMYSVFINRNEARLMRWDRCGCVMTEPFDHIKGSAVLLNFLYALATGDRAFQGYDTFINLVDDNSSELHELLQAKAGLSDWKPNKYEERFLDEMAKDRLLYPIHRVRFIAFIHMSGVTDCGFPAQEPCPS